MKRIKIKIPYSKDIPQRVKDLLYKALKKGYHYKTDNFDKIKYAHCLILHPEYGISHCMDNEFCRMIDFETISYEEFMSEAINKES